MWSLCGRPSANRPGRDPLRASPPSAPVFQGWGPRRGASQPRPAPASQRRPAGPGTAKRGHSPHPPGSHAPRRRPLPRLRGLAAALRARPARPARGAAGQIALRRHRRRHSRRRPEHSAPRAPRAASSWPARRPRRSRQPHSGAPARSRAAATTPRAVLRVKNGAAKLPKPPAAAAAAAAEAPGAGAGMERSQSRLSLSASFEALAIYFPCMNSFDDEDAGKRAARPQTPGVSRDPGPEAPTPTRAPLEGLLRHSRDPRVSGMRCLLAFSSRYPEIVGPSARGFGCPIPGAPTRPPAIGGGAQTLPLHLCLGRIQRISARRQRP
ncbi:hypothetical protein P7K49_009780 [Saguinus oedipus]|uniref:Uncharacterized protein n=1 Tax=Saguinus oedipus TaxID=9490 RepID=A0ABQ9VMC7_SAGOE|nr:hypothetical protein P7K49_009780 [Saguinus oedipus]